MPERPSKARRRFHTDRIVAHRRARYIREPHALLEPGPLEHHRAELFPRLEYGVLADHDPWDCGSRCGLCHFEKLFCAGERRRRENRSWRADWDL